MKLKALERAFAQLHITCTSSALQQGSSSLSNSPHGLILQTCTPASEAYSWKHYACIPDSERLGRNLLPGLPWGHGWHLALPERQPGTISRAPAAQQATKPGQEMPHAPKDTLWPRSGLTWMFSDDTRRQNFFSGSSASKQLPTRSRDVPRSFTKSSLSSCPSLCYQSLLCGVLSFSLGKFGGWNSSLQQTSCPQGWA